jgi:hypothetical protein
MGDAPAPEQAAFLMRHLSDDDRARLIAEAGDKVIDLCGKDAHLGERIKGRRKDDASPL